MRERGRLLSCHKNGDSRVMFKSCSLEVAKKKANLNFYLFKPEGETFFCCCCI